MVRRSRGSNPKSQEQSPALLLPKIPPLAHPHNAGEPNLPTRRAVYRRVDETVLTEASPPTILFTAQTTSVVAVPSGSPR